MILNEAGRLVSIVNLSREGFQTATELLDHAALANAASGETVDGRVQLMTLHKGTRPGVPARLPRRLG